MHEDTRAFHDVGVSRFCNLLCRLDLTTAYKEFDRRGQIFLCAVRSFATTQSTKYEASKFTYRTLMRSSRLSF